MPMIRPAGRPKASISAPSVLGSVLLAENETEGTSPATATMAGITAAGTLFTWRGILTANAGAPTLNNGNTATNVFSQAYPAPFTLYDIRGDRVYNAAGGSAHALTITKGGLATQELTLVGLLLDRGTIVSSAVTQQGNAGAGHTFTSGTVTTTGPALLVATSGGDGAVNATAPTETYPGDWTVLQFVARTSVQAPAGHVPFYLATKQVGQAGTYSVDVQVTIDEGLIQSLYAVQ